MILLETTWWKVELTSEDAAEGFVTKKLRGFKIGFKFHRRNKMIYFDTKAVKIPAIVEKSIMEHFNPTPPYEILLDGNLVGAHNNRNRAVGIANRLVEKTVKGAIAVQKEGKTVFHKEVDREAR